MEAVMEELFLSWDPESQRCYNFRHSDKCRENSCIQCTAGIETNYNFRFESYTEGTRKNSRAYASFPRNNAGIKNMINYFTKLPLKFRHYHETIPQEVPRKIFIDFDDKPFATAHPDLCSKRDGKAYIKAITRVLDKVIVEMAETIMELYIEKESNKPLDLDRKDFMVFISEGWEQQAGRYKVGFHVILNGYCFPGESLKTKNTFGSLFEKRFAERTINIKYFEVDPKMNRSTTDLRFIGNYKVGSNRVKKLMEGQPKIKYPQALIMYTDDCVELKMNEECEYVKLMLEVPEYIYPEFDGDLKDIDTICSRLKKQFTDQPTWVQICHHLSDISGGSKQGFDIFDKWSKDHCPEKYGGRDECKKLYKSFADKRGNSGIAYKALLNMLWNVDVKLYAKMKDQAQKTTCEKVETKAINDVNDKFEFTIEDERIEITKIHKEYMPKNSMKRKEELSTTVIRSPMKTGKTQELARMFESMIKKNPDIRIIIITHRRSLTDVFKGKLKDLFVSYKNEEGSGKLTQNRLIVQLESLKRIPLDSCKYDYVVIDEYLGVKNHYLNSSRLTIDARKVFEYIMRQSNHAIIMDALIDDDGLRMILTHRDLEMKVIQNTVQKTTEKCIIYKNVWAMLRLMMKKIKQGKRIVVPTTTKVWAKKVYKYILQQIEYEEIEKDEGEFDIQLYTGDSDDVDKDFTDVNNKWKTADVLIFTPTVSEGVSYDHKGFDYVFGIFTDRSTTAEVACQLTHRVREISSLKYYCHIAHSPGSIEITEKSIRKGLTYESRLVKEYIKRGLIECEDDDSQKVGEIHHKIKETPYFRALILNHKRVKTSEVKFFDRFVELTRQSGATIIFNKCEESNETKNKQIKKEFTVIGKSNTEEKMQDIAELKTISDEEYNDLVGKKIKTEEDRRNIYRYTLRKKWGFRGKITADVVKRFQPEKIEPLIKTFERIAFDDLNGSLRYLADESKSNIERNIHKAIFPKVEISIDILRKCGYADDKIEYKKIKSEKLLKNMQNCIEPMLKKQSAIKLHFHKKNAYTKIQLQSKDLKAWLQMINPILTSTFDMKIIKEDKHSDKYILKPSELFGTSKKQIPFPKTISELWKELYAKNLSVVGASDNVE